jgi:hypothetical protein
VALVATLVLAVSRRPATLAGAGRRPAALAATMALAVFGRPATLARSGRRPAALAATMALAIFGRPAAFAGSGRRPTALTATMTLAVVGRSAAFAAALVLAILGRWSAAVAIARGWRRPVAARRRPAVIVAIALAILAILGRWPAAISIARGRRAPVVVVPGRRPMAVVAGGAVLVVARTLPGSLVVVPGMGVGGIRGAAAHDHGGQRQAPEQGGEMVGGSHGRSFPCTARTARMAGVGAGDQARRRG